MHLKLRMQLLIGKMSLIIFLNCFDDIWLGKISIWDMSLSYVTRISGERNKLTHLFHWVFRCPPSWLNLSVFSFPYSWKRYVYPIAFVVRENKWRWSISNTIDLRKRNEHKYSSQIMKAEGEFILFFRSAFIRLFIFL